MTAIYFVEIEFKKNTSELEIWFVNCFFKSHLFPQKEHSIDVCLRFYIIQTTPILSDFI